MAVFKRRVCEQCGKQVRDKALKRKRPACVKCGGLTTYSVKWYVSVSLLTESGRKEVVKAISADRGEAVKEERRLLTDRDQGAVVRTGVKTGFKDAAQVFLRWVDTQEEQGKIAAGTARPYRYRLNSALLPFFGDFDVRHIDFDAADAYVAHRGCDVAPATVNREIATLKKLLSVCVQKRIIPQHALVGYSMQPEDNERDVYLTHDQVRDLLLECSGEKYSPHLWPIVMVALNTGMRKEGCLTLRWEEIDWKRLEICKRVKGSKLVRIPLTPLLKDVLLDLRTEGGVVRTAGPVFPSPKTGQPMLVTSRIGFKAACEAIGLEGVTFHTTRHTFATHFLEQFPDKIEVLRVILGHSSSYMTRRYAHITEGARTETMSQLRIGE